MSQEALASRPALGVPLEVLACPACRSALAFSGGGLRCERCREEYPLAGGVPLLLTPDDARRFGARLTEAGGRAMEVRYRERYSSALATRLRQALRPPLPLIDDPREPRLPRPDGSLNLYIGGGGRTVAGFLNLDIRPFPGVGLVGNAERLPLGDAVLDGVECDAVLEHVEHPETALREVFRALKPGGFFHVVVPFCHPFHAYPADFRRWTLFGLEDSLRETGFSIIASGVRTGPTATLLTFVLEYGKLAAGGGLAGKAVYAALGWFLFPLRYLDLWLNRRPSAHLLANHVFALARKPN